MVQHEEVWNVREVCAEHVTGQWVRVEMTDGFQVEVGLHQGLALSPFLSAVVIDMLTDEVRQESTWTMIFIDDFVICNESKEQLKQAWAGGGMP